MTYKSSTRFILFVFLLINPIQLGCSNNITVEQSSPSSISTSLKTPNKKIDIQKVMDYPIPHIIARYRKDYNVSQDDAKIHEIELKRYLILAADISDDTENLDMMSTKVDNLWHTFLLFTKDYQIFC